MQFNNDAANQLSYMAVEGFNGTTWDELLRVTGQQQNGGGLDWLKATVDASTYTNNDFKFRIRFIFIGTNASAWRDFAWANPKIFDGMPT